MDIEGRRRSSNIEDRGSARASGIGTRGSGASGGGGLPVRELAAIVQKLGFKGTAIVGVLLAVVHFVAPKSVTQALLRAITGGSPSPATAGPPTGGSVCESSSANAKACDFSRVVLASTEDVWDAQFQANALPSYGPAVGAYQHPTLVVFSGSVSTGGCGSASASVGPFYCPADMRLYINPSFYDVMERHLKAPGDFAQAYVIAHEVGHHIQNLMGSTRLSPRGESKNQVSVRVELQADCLAGVWGHTARASLKITDEDLREAVTAAHAIGDDTLGHSNATDYTHGTSAQRIRWFRIGFDGGDARRCDTFAVKSYADL